jgi:hypothetical protein
LEFLGLIWLTHNHEYCLESWRAKVAIDNK